MPDLGKIKDQLSVLEKFSEFYENPICSDVILVVGKEKFVAHRFVLAAHARFFQVLLFGLNFSETNQPEVAIEAPSSAFKLLLKYMYTGMLDLRSEELQIVADLLELSHRYGLTKLQSQIIDYLCVAVDAKNACAVLEIASLIGAEKLEEKCWFLIEAIVEGIYEIELFLDFMLLEKFLKRPKIMTEAKLFTKVHQLIQKKDYCTEEQKSYILQQLNFNRMTPKELAIIVRPTQLLKDSILFNLICTELAQDAKWIDSFSKIKSSVKVTADKNEEFLFSVGEEYASSEIKDENHGIMIDLGALYRFNHLEFKLNPRNNEYYKYFVEVSKTQKDWDRIIDYQKTDCRKFQNLCFPETTARFIKIFGTNFKQSKVFECNSFQVNFTDALVRFLGGYIFPTRNVATHEKAFANVRNSLDQIEFESQLLNGKYEENGTATPYTTQTIESGSLWVRFRQPYVLDSCRFRLWDFDGRKYSYKVVTTIDEKNFETISDKSDEMVDGWQLIKFSPRPVLLFMITGIQASVGNELRLVHFEAPSQVFEIVN